MMKNKTNNNSFRHNAIFTLATSVVDKLDYWQTMDPLQVENIKKTLENHSEVKVVVDQILEARKNPVATKKLVTDAKAAHKKSDNSRTDGDLMSIMMANLILSQDNNQYLSSEVTEAIQNDPHGFKGFGGGDFGGSGSSGTYDAPTHAPVHQDYHSNHHDTIHDNSINDHNSYNNDSWTNNDSWSGSDTGTSFNCD